MSQKTRYQLEVLRDSLIRSGGVGGKTTAENLRDFQTAIIESLLNILDDADQDGGFLQVNNGRVNASLINEAIPTGRLLDDSGTFKLIYDAGESTQTGDNVTTTFEINHNLGQTPSAVLITAKNSLTAADMWTDNFTPTKFDLTFKVAPVAGVNNILLNYLAIL